MKLTQKKLRQIIKEELTRLQEGTFDTPGADFLVSALMGDIMARVKYLRGQSDEDPLFSETGAIYQQPFQTALQEFGKGPYGDPFGRAQYELAFGTLELVVDNASEAIADGSETLSGARKYIESNLSSFMAGERP